MHLKIDTGMNRIGASTDEEVRQFLSTLEETSDVNLVGVFSHFAKADMYGNSAPAEDQYQRLMRAVDAVRKAGYDPIVHISNSAAAQNLPQFDCDMVRFGISLYGYPAGDDVPARDVELHPALSIQAEISHIKNVPAGTPIGYGGTFVTERPSRIATVQIGYGDGYPRLLSNKGRMIVETDNGPAFAPVVGRVCMDMTMIDITGLEGINTGDRVIALGSLGDLKFDADDIAAICDTISYEVLCDITSRVPRLYGG